VIGDLRHRLRALLRRDAVERDLDDELRDHLEREVERLTREGLARDDAERRARAELGLEPLKEACRDARGTAPIERMFQDVAYAGRVLRKHPAFTCTVAVTLALGIGATTTMFSVLDAVVLRALPYRDPGALVQIGARFGQVQVGSISAPDFDDLSARLHTLSGIAAARSRTADVTGDGPPRRLHAAAVSSSFFDVLGVAPAQGVAFRPEHDRPGAPAIAIVSHTLWRDHFAADPAVVGRTLAIGGVPHAVVGVMPADFRTPDVVADEAVDLWLPLGSARKPVEDRDDASLAAIGRLARHATIAAAETEIGRAQQDLAREYPASAGRHFWIAALHERTVGAAGRQLWLMFGAVALLLAIAIANVANLFLVRATSRAREMAIRAAMGASRGRIFRQLIAESLLFSLAGGALGSALSYAGVAGIRAFGPADLPRLHQVSIDPRVLAFAFLLSVIAGLAFGLVPAIDATRAGLASGLRDAAASVTTGRPRLRLRSALVVAQTTIAVMLVAGASLLARSWVRLGAVEPGFDPRDVGWAEVALPPGAYATAPARLAFFDDLVARLRSLPGVVSVGGIEGRPLGGGNSVVTVLAETDAPDPESATRVPMHVVAPGYFETMKIPVIDGRSVRDDDRAGAPRVVVVSRTFASTFWPGDRAVGRRMWIGRVALDAPLFTVAGVVDDVRQYGLAEPPQPMVYRPLGQAPRATLSVMVRHDGRREAEIAQSMRQAVWAIDSALPVDRLGTMSRQVRTSIAEPAFRALALSTFARVAAALALVGLYGTLSWIARARRRELGIRVVLGAAASDVSRLVIARGLMMAGAGIAVGTAAALAMSRLLASLLFGVSSTDLATFAGVAAAMSLAALVACWLPARRAAAVDPVEILRE
jgi:putative ABC transport system permease protein